jgi:NTP pyrophosphatase (non-canonical NTP hydrolase)
MELSQIQKLHEGFVRSRGWDRFPASLLFVHLEEELSEIGKHILFEEGYKAEGMGDSTRREDVKSEVGQVFSLLLQLASHFNIDVEGAFLEEHKKNEKRFPIEKWKEYMESKEWR